MDSGSARKVEDLLARPEVRGCQEAEPEVLDSFGAGPERPGSLFAAAKSFPVVAAGRVTGTAPGFYIGHPGTLVRAETIEPSRNIEIGTSFFFFVPVAEFRLLGKKVCARDSQYAVAPQPGDEVVVFGYLPPGYSVQYLQAPFPESLIVARGDRLFSAMPRNHLPSTRGELFRQIDRLPPHDAGEMQR